MEFSVAPPDQDLVRRMPDVGGNTDIVGNPNEEEPFRGCEHADQSTGKETQAVEIAVECVVVRHTATTLQGRHRMVALFYTTSGKRQPGCLAAPPATSSLKST